MWMEAINNGFWRATVTQTGVQIIPTVEALPAASTSSTILLSMFPAGVRRQFPFHLVKVSCIPWSVVFAMACFLWHVQSLFG
jgi:hypothetical protein